MRGWPVLAVAPAGALVLLVVLLLRTSPDPARREVERTDLRPPAERPDDDVAARGTEPGPGTLPAEEERDDERLRAIPGTERWHYEGFLRLAAADRDRFDRLADEKANSAAPLQERIALLRAAWKVRGKDALHWFADAFAGAAGSPDEAENALRGFVVRHLASQARAEPTVREFLKDRVFLDETVAPRDRSVAGRAVLRAADPGEISSLLAVIQRISDADVAGGALLGLGLNDLDDAAFALTWLSRNHPQEQVRERAAEVSRQRSSGNVEEEGED